jgi:hypothetical protein
MTKSTASFIPQIKAAYQEAIKASETSLDHAIKTGGLLNLAKENADAEKLAWLPWLKQNLPEIPQTTASLYMRLAKNKDVIDKQRVASLKNEGVLSVRSAAKLIPPTEAGAKAAATRKAKKATKEEEAKASVVPTTIVDQLRELRDADVVLNLLVEAFDPDFLDTLEECLSKHLEPKEGDDLDVRNTPLRRLPHQAQQ